MTKNPRSTGSWIDHLGLGAIALAGLGYVVFSSSFAEIYLGLPFLDFPIFVGELLLAFGSVLLALKLLRREWRIGQERWALGVYVAFVLFKAIFGYWKWGPMALRDAAMFYYPAFALFGYCFWTPHAWGRWERRGVFAVILVVLLFHSYHFFWPLSLVLLALVLARREEEPPVRLLFLSAVLLLTPYDAFFSGVRTVVVAAVGSTVFLFAALASAIRVRRHFTFLWIALGLMTLLVFVARATQSGFWNRVDPRRILSGLREPATVSSWELPSCKLYNPDRVVEKRQPDIRNAVKPPDGGNWSLDDYVVREAPAQLWKAPVLNGAHRSDVYNTFASVPARTDHGALVSPQKNVPAGRGGMADHGYWPVRPHRSPSFTPARADIRSINVDMDNARFRLYIWRDLLIEYWKEKPVFGFDFGHPLRSPSMKAYGYSTAQDEDGWLGAHNSFLYLIYKGGMVGLAVIVLVLVLWGGLVRDMVRMKSFEGILLCAVLLNCMLSANFFLFFELPYTAIPFWSLFGIAAKYRSTLRKRSRRGGAPALDIKNGGSWADSLSTR